MPDATSEVEMVQQIQATFMQFDRRAEKVSQDILARTFVDAEPLFIQLSSRNHQVFYGRRGTGKTHALKYLAETLRARQDMPIYVDLRSVGSNGSIYSDGKRTLAERASRLIIDVLEAVEQELTAIAIEQIDNARDAQQITMRLDDLGAAIRSVEVKGTVEEEKTTSEAQETNKTLSGKSDMKTVELSGGFGRKNAVTDMNRTKHSGEASISIDFGPLQGALSGLVDVLGSPTIWLLIDEWSEIPIDLQPYLADLIRRTILPQPRMIVKIAAIEHRSQFAELGSGGSYVGIEIGADVTADINLDDFVVYDVDQRRATEFFKNLIFKHYQVGERANPLIDTADKLISAAFTQVTAFEEYVRAIEGVPRDALNLAAAMGRIAFGRKIGVTDVRKAAREWYQQDKMSVTKSAPVLADVLNHIINEVIENRRTRAFLFPAASSSTEIDRLYDARLLHLLKKSIASNDEPGRRYHVYKIDYGCYVDLISTSRAPGGLLAADEGTYVDVPPDDYRSIRRAILKPEEIIPYQA
ncbi:ATP-binding protein [Bradyrhizobium sp. HKCCYLRH3061]|uniref:ATP-binding protein n=1 Tax=Bradyrhizobium sp. HKCCYLRH3061 TaxID=3420734 RepID=UPI003EBD738B